MTTPNMSAGAAAVDAFRKGQLPPSIAGQDEIALTNPRTESIDHQNGYNQPADFDAGYRLLDQGETDSGLPPDFKDEKQAALHAQLRGFEVLSLKPDGTPVPDWQDVATSDPASIRERWAGAPRCKVGAVTSGLIVLSVSREGFNQIEALAGGKRTHTAAVCSYGDESATRFILRLPDGIRSPEENISLAPGVDVLSDDGYIELPSGSQTDTCYWINRRPIAMAPQWLVDKLAALAASQTNGNEAAGAAETADAEKDPTEIVQPTPDVQPIETAVKREAQTASAYSRAFTWIGSDDSPEVTDSNVREILPKLTMELRKRFDVSLAEAIDLIGPVADCELSSAEIEQIVRQAYSADRAPASSAKPAGNPDMALGFLDGLDPSGRHDLATFDPPDCATFLFPDERESARRWIDARQGRKSIYVSVNRAREDARRNERLNHKERKEIELIRAITADIDIPDIESDDLSEKRQHFQAMKAKLLKEVAPKLAELERRPSMIVASGGGLQLWWQLKEAVPTAENGDKAEGIGRAIGELLQAELPEYKLDTISDLVRVMRLPGTINIPNATKRKRGRSDAPAIVLAEHCSGKRYSLDELAAWAPPTSKRQSKSSEEALPEIDMGLVKSAVEYEELPEELRAKFESAREHDPALRGLWEGNQIRAQKDDSGSGAAFAFAGRLKRNGGFTATEFGQLLYVWEHGYELEKINARTIARDWNRHPEGGPTSVGFDSTQTGERPPAEAESKGDEDKKDESETEQFVSLATPFSCPHAATIEPTRWVVVNLAIRGEVTTVTGPGGVSKSTWALLLAVATATGRSDICGFPIPKREPAWVWNQEDSEDTMNARLLAIMEEHKVSPDDLKDENGNMLLFINSGRGRGNRLTLVKRVGDFLEPTKDLETVIQTAVHERTGLHILDPLVSIHQAPENSNEQMRVVFDHLADIAHDANCAVVVICHPGKPDKKSSEGFAGDAYAARGASSQPDAARVAATLTKMSEADSKNWCIPSGSHVNYVRLDIPKINDAATPDTRWYWRKQILVPGYRGGRLPVLVPVELEPTAMVAEDMAAGIAEAIRDHHGLETWVSIADLLQHLPTPSAALLAGKNRARDLNRIFNFKPEMAVAGVGVLKRVAGLGPSGTKLMLSKNDG